MPPFLSGPDNLNVQRWVAPCPEDPDAGKLSAALFDFAEILEARHR